MTDIEKALEKAAEAIAEEDGASAATPVDRIWARAAVLAFLKAMPVRDHIGTLMLPFVIAAAIEKETTP